MHPISLCVFMDSLSSRVRRVFEHCDNDLEQIIIVNTGAADPNFLYLSGFTSGLFEYSYLLISQGSVTLLTSVLEYETARSEASEEMEVICINNSKELSEHLEKFAEGKKIGINEGFVPYLTYKGIKKRAKPKKIVDISDALLETRIIKDDEEIARIRKAVGITKLALVLIQKEFVEGMTELQLASKFDGLSSSLGSEEPSFKTIVCFGKNAALPHHFPDDTKLRRGDFILIDAGAKIRNYCSDLTRTFIFGEEVLKENEDYLEKKRMYDTVKQAQLKAIRAIKPGLKGKDIHNIAQEYIDNAFSGEYRGRFIHSLGHSIGIEVHDGQGFSPNSDLVLKPGMIISVEPGIYLPGFGGVRIEDDILIEDDGALVL